MDDNGHAGDEASEDENLSAGSASETDEDDLLLEEDEEHGSEEEEENFQVNVVSVVRENEQGLPPNAGAARVNNQRRIRMSRMLRRLFAAGGRRIAEMTFQPIAERFQTKDLAKDEDRPTNITFNQNLPSSHSYLGDMDDCCGVQYMEKDIILTVPLFEATDLVLMPGQTLPLNLTHPKDLSLFRNVMSREDKTFAVLLTFAYYDMPGQVGCTAELRSLRMEEVNDIETMVGIAIGRQRFRRLRTQMQPDGNCMVDIQILGEDELLPPASGASLNVQRKYSILPRKSGRKFDRTNLLEAGWLTQWPPWVHHMYDVEYLRKWIINELKEWYPQIDEKSLPSTPAAFSFWVASNSIITIPMKLKLLSIHSSIQRLRIELDILKKFVICTCSNCGHDITHRDHMFIMSATGPMNTFVNPSGHIHETITVYFVMNLDVVSRPSTEHSWFPGYAWSICQCKLCHQHLGWMFTATNSSLEPKKFWGLTRSSLKPRMESESSETTHRTEPYPDQFNSLMWEPRM